MELFSTILLKLVPLYLLIAAGFFVTRAVKANQKNLAPYLVYIIIPIVVFDAVYRMELTPSTILLPVMIWAIASAIALISYRIARNGWKDGTAHVIGFGTGGANFGYFGVPVAIALFGEEIRSTAVLFLIAYMLFETTVGYSLIYPKHLSRSNLIAKILKLPAFYALLAGLICNISGLTLPALYTDLTNNIYGTFFILGSLIIGIGIAGWKKTDLDIPFIAFMMIAKFVLWPAIIGIVIILDRMFLNMFSPDTHKVLFLMSLVPIAANTVTYAALLNVKPEKAAMAVIVSTLVSLLYIPFMLGITGF